MKDRIGEHDLELLEKLNVRDQELAAAKAGKEAKDKKVTP